MGGDLSRVVGLVAPVHLVKRALKQHVGGIIFHPIVRTLARNWSRPYDCLGLDRNRLVD